jgi:DNA-binding LytR/AlgR family response regulator
LKTKPSILIVEDEPIIADDIAFILEDEGYKILGKAIDTQEAIYIIEQSKPDIVLLDISLEGDDEDGIDLANLINEKYQIPFVFITSHSDKLTINRVKKTNPCGFIIKPFKATDIISTLAIVSYKIIKDKAPSVGDNQNSFFVKQGHDLIKIKFSDIIYIKAENNYTYIIMEHKKILASLNLKSLTEKLPSNSFFRVHRSYVININKITRISHRFIYIDTHEIPLGRGYYAKLQDLITTL